MAQIAPSRKDDKIKIFGIQTLLPSDIIHKNGGNRAVPVLRKMVDGAVDRSIGCGPISPVIGTNGYLDKQLPIGSCISDSHDLRSNCYSPWLQITAPASKCNGTEDWKTGGNCRWSPFDTAHPYRQVESNSETPYGNLLMDAPTAAKYLSITPQPQWTTILNGQGCDYPPFTSDGCKAPGISPAACSPSRLKCTYSPGSDISLWKYLHSYKTPGFKPPPNPCLSINPTTNAPSSFGWKDSTCSIFYDVVTRAAVSLDQSQESNLSNFPMKTGLYKPTLFNNVPFNYNGALGVSADVGSYCYVPDPNSCPDIGDAPGTLHGIAKPTQEQDWFTDGFGEYDNAQHLLCEYNVPAGKIISNAPGGFIKTDKDFHSYLKQKVGQDDFFTNYQGFPYNDTIYQYIMLEKCLEPVEDHELKDCLGIDGNFGPVLKHHGLKKNPIGMHPETYWNDAYRLDPMLETKPSDSSLECTSDCYLRELNQICSYESASSPCSTCANASPTKTHVLNNCSPNGLGSIPPATINKYCTDCQKPIVYSPDSPRCARMNKSTKDGHECRKWYKQTSNNYRIGIENTVKKKTNPEYTRAIYYNNCLREEEKKYNDCAEGPGPSSKCGKKKDWLSKCGNVTTAPSANGDQETFIPPEKWDPYPQEYVPGTIPIYKPGPPPSAVDWDATRKELRLGNSPGSISFAFNRKAKEFCSQPSSKYLWECGCINASAKDSLNQNHYWNIYNSMEFAPAPPDSKYKEGYFSATKDQEDAKYCWLQPCKYPFGAGGTDITNLNDPVRFADLTLGMEAEFQNKDMSVCPEFDCESIVITTPDSFIDQTTMTNVISATGADQVCSSVKNAFWIQDPIVCAYGPSAESLTPIDSPSSPPGYLKLPPGAVRDPGNWCYDSRKLYTPGSPARKVKYSDQTAYMLEQMCFNGCHNWSPVAVKPQQPQAYAYPTFSCEKSGCVEYLPDSPASRAFANSPASKEGLVGLGEFFDPDDCKKECKIRNLEEKRELWYVIIIVISIIAGFFALLAIRKLLKYKAAVRKYKETRQKKLKE